LNALPVGLSGKAFYFNKTTYEKAGLEIPKSFEEMRAAAKVFKEKLGPEYYPFDTDSYGAFLFMIYKLEQETGKPFIVNDEVAYTKEQFEDAAKFYTGLVKDGVMPSLSVRAAAGNVPLDQHPSWIQGRYAGTYEWDSAAKKWQDSLEQGQELVLGDFMKDFGPYPSAFFKVSMAYAINKNVKNPKETAQLLNFIVSDATATEILGESRGVPANKKALKVLEEKGMATGLVFEANKKVVDFAGKGIHPLFEHPKLQKSLRDLVEQLGYNQINEAQFAEKIIAETNEFLAKEMKKK
jgi:oligogalacturonide transport system substrate-binding protein